MIVTLGAVVSGSTVIWNCLVSGEAMRPSVTPTVTKTDESAPTGTSQRRRPWASTVIPAGPSIRENASESPSGSKARMS